jgi:hypothetical protein
MVDLKVLMVVLKVGVELLFVWCLIGRRWGWGRWRMCFLIESTWAD